MLTLYQDDLTNASAIVSKYQYRLYSIDRLYCPQEMRGQGGARRVMQAVCKDADRFNVTLVLVTIADGGLTHDQLVSFYESCGFVETSMLHYHRFPRCTNGLLPAMAVT